MAIGLGDFGFIGVIGSRFRGDLSVFGVGLSGG